MDEARWKRVETLFAAALDRPSGAERETWLAEQCGGDADLEREVLQLLASDAGAEDYLRRAVGEAAAEVGTADGDAPTSHELTPPPFSGTSPGAAPERLGKYEVLGILGRGGFGVVHRARDPLLDREVAIKVVPAKDPEMRRRFLREGRIAARLQHPCVTAVHDLGVEEDRLYLVQELLSGEDLRELLSRGEPLAPSRKLDILAGVARGLEYAHGQGVLHRDVKPANVRVLADGSVKLMDFGIARFLDRTDQRVTRTGVALGTVGYLAPEQLAAKELDERADVFSFGVLAYELLSGEVPFPGETFSEISYKLLYERAPSLDETWPECPPALALLVADCLERDVSRRPSSFREVLARLEPLTQDLATLPVPSQRPRTDENRATERLPTSAPRRGTSGALAAGFVLALAVAGGAFWRSSAPDGSALPSEAADGSAAESSAALGSSTSSEAPSPPLEVGPDHDPHPSSAAPEPSEGGSPGPPLGNAPVDETPPPTVAREPEQARGPVFRDADPPAPRQDPAAVAAEGPAQSDEPAASRASPSGRTDGSVDGPSADPPPPVPGPSAGGGVERVRPGAGPASGIGEPDPALASGSEARPAVLPPPPPPTSPVGPGSGEPQGTGQPDRPSEAVPADGGAPEGDPPAVPVLQAGAGVAAPAVLVAVEPELPPKERRRIRGAVEVEVLVLVGVDGRPEVVRVLDAQGAPESLVSSARDAAHSTVFERPRHAGAPARVWTKMVFRFVR